MPLNHIDIYLDGHQCATVDRHKLLSFGVNTESIDSWTTTRLINTILCHTGTPVRTYNDAEVYDAKVLADKQGAALVVEMVDVDD